MIAIATLLLPQFNAVIPTMSYESAYPAVPVEIGQPFDLKINQSAYFQSSELAIKFVNITEDSRCPSDVTCVWEGQASVLVSFNASGGKSAGNFTLTIRGSGSADLSTKAVNGYLLRLVDVQPYPTSKQKISLSDYTARFVLSKDEGQAVSRGVLVKAVNYQNLENNATTVTAFISGWNVEKGTGAAVIFMQEHGSIFKRVMVKFIPSNASNCTQQNAECIDGQITQTDRNSTGGLIHLEIDSTKTKLLLAYSPSKEGGMVQDTLNVTGFRVWLKPIAAPGNSSMVALKEGERDGPLLVQKIYPDRIEGLNFIEYPIARGEGTPITLHIGEKASNGCTVALTLVKIEYGTAIFVKTVDQNRPCPICWIQQAMLSGHNDAGY